MTKFPRTPQRLDRLYIRDPLYFITCCSYRRRPVLATPVFHDAFVRFCEHANKEFGVVVGRYVIMPDHMHFFVSLPADKLLGQWIGTLKRIVGAAVQRNSADAIWQRGFFDHVMRSSQSYDQKWEYVRENPVRAGLAKCSADWPYAGEIVPVAYH